MSPSLVELNSGIFWSRPGNMVLEGSEELELQVLSFVSSSVPGTCAVVHGILSLNCLYL